MLFGVKHSSLFCLSDSDEKIKRISKNNIVVSFIVFLSDFNAEVLS
jgi:hypothetical protein